MKDFFKNNYLIILIVFIGGYLRFFNPLWDNGLFLHPDERLFINASNLSMPTSIQEFFSINSPLNPHMFYYGSFLLYIYKLVSLISPASFLMTSRMISAFLSALTIGVVFAIGKEIFSKKVGLLSSIIFAFAAGSIQYAHFNTTESSLIFLVSLITYIDILTIKKSQPYLLLISLFLVGIAGAIKITGILFGISPFLVALLLLRERRLWKQVVIYSVIGFILFSLIYIFFSPYQFIDWSEFITQQSYMQAVTYGVFKPPFVIIYQNTIPYLYQLIHVFPFIFGFASFPLAVVGLFFIVKKIIMGKKIHIVLVFLLAFPLVYYAWSGSWFAKYARYYLLLLPFLSIWAGYALNKVRSTILYIFLTLICLNGLLFFRIYLSTNTRIIASEWIYNHLPLGSVIATEHWDDALPLILKNTKNKYYTMITLPVYDSDTLQKTTTLATLVSRSNFIILSSRRVYVSILQNPHQYPQTNNFYKELFSGALGFQKVYEKNNYPFILSDDFADETFQSYDHPPVVIFQNMRRYSSQEIASLIRHY